MNKITTYHSDGEFVSEVTAKIVSRIKQKDGLFRIALSGGSTPGPLYSRLAESDIDWSQVEVYLVDERYVPADSEYSNHRLITETLLSKIPAEPKKWVSFDCSLTIEEALKKYESELDASDPQFFDLVILGMGTDGHTASLFPGDPLLNEEVRWVGHSSHGDPIPDRLTLTYPALESSQEIWFLVKGEKKRSILHKVQNSVLDLPATKLFHLEYSRLHLL